MSGDAVRKLLPIALAAGLIVAFGTAGLPAPARAVTIILTGVLPPLLLLQAAIPDAQVQELRPIPVYSSSMALICALGALAFWGGIASGFAPEDMGIAGVGLVTGVLWAGGVVLTAIGVLALGRALRWRETPMLELLLPRTNAERVVFVLLSLAAGVFEEIAFRGFLIPALRMVTDSLLVAVVLSSVAFGMMHGYQSVTGTLRAGALGAVLAVPFLVTGSLLPSMAAHALYDVIAGLLLADWALRRGDHRH